MKTLEQFVKDNEGQFLEVAGSSNAKFQCVDCVNGYIRDVLGFPIIEWTNAIDFKNKANGNYDIIYNDINNPSLVPDVGDIVVYRHPNKIGHIGVCIKKGVASSFGIFEENWPVGSPCKSVLTKKYIIGDYVVDYWMRPKKSIIEDMTEEQKKVLELLENYKITAGHGNLEGAINTLIGNVTELRNATESIENFKKDIETLKANINSLNSKYSELEAKFIENQKINEKQQKALVTANDKISELDKTIENLTADKNSWQLRYNNKNDDFNNLSKLFEEYKKCNPKTETKFNLIQFIISLFKK